MQLGSVRTATLSSIIGSSESQASPAARSTHASHSSAVSWSAAAQRTSSRLRIAGSS